MAAVNCPFCGMRIMVDVLTCPSCGRSLNDFETDDNYNQEKINDDANLFMASVVDFLYQAVPFRFPDIDISNVIDNLKIYKPEIPSEVTEMVSNIELPKFDLSELDIPDIDIPEVDITGVLELFGNVDLSDVDLSPLADILANVDVSDVDLSPLFDFLADIDIDF